MCEVTTTGLLIASLASAAVGTATSVYGQVQAGKSQEAQADYQAAVGRNNAILAERQARDAEERGAAEELAQRRQTVAAIGRQKTAMGANGVDLGSGSPLDILGDTAMFGELDALTVRSNAAREAWGYRQQGSQFTSDAAATSIAGRNARSASYIGAGSTLLTGASQVAGNWAKFGGASAASSRTGYTSGIVNRSTGRMVGGV